MLQHYAHTNYNAFLRSFTKLHINHIHKHYITKILNPTAIMNSTVLTEAFFLILYSYQQHYTVSGTVQEHDIKGCPLILPNYCSYFSTKIIFGTI